MQKPIGAPPTSSLLWRWDADAVKMLWARTALCEYIFLLCCSCVHLALMYIALIAGYYTFKAHNLNKQWNL